MAATLRTTLRFVESATQDEVDALLVGVSQRMETLRREREESLTPGMDVRLRDLSPESLNGLTGTVKTLVTSRGQRRCSVLLDVGSTKNLRGQSNRFAATVSPMTKRHLLEGVPMKCCEATS